MFIFNFHYVDPVCKHEDRKHITITPEGLKRFIRLLRFAGMEIISLKDVVQYGHPIEPRSNDVILTFDDGYENFYEYAAPVLEAEHCPATVFVLPGKFSGTNDWDQGKLPEEERDRLMSLEQMKELCGSKYITFGSHGMYHRKFSQLSKQELKTEIFDSHAILYKELFPSYIPVLAYPWGDYNNDVLAMMEQSPYQYAFTTNKGEWLAGDPAYEIVRHSAYYRDGNPLVFTAKLIRNRIPLPVFRQSLSAFSLKEAF